MREVIIDGKKIKVDPALTILQACEKVNIEIPRFCYHERLSIAGNCRMCLVEVVGGPPKPTASCAMQIKDLRPGPNGEPPSIKTSSPMVIKAREGVMEFLLINHPLDCPICDQGGECDLQDQAVSYGIDFSRYREPKRASENLNLGPLVETHMTRCISCTRCVRFTTEVAGITQMGQTGRGEDSEITSYLNQTLSSELQGNIIDLCPVGALTSKPYAFSARSWELKKTDSIDVMDALGSNIRVDCKGREVKRILPRNHDGVNEEWISDKTRFVWDGLRRQRLDRPYIRRAGKLIESTWEDAFQLCAKKIQGSNFVSLVGDLVSCETIFALKTLSLSLGGSFECRVDNVALHAQHRSGYLGNAAVEDIDECDEIYLIGTNPRLECPVLNARIRKAWLNGAIVKLIGTEVDLTYDYEFLGSGRFELNKLLEKKKSKKVGQFDRVVILGQGAIADDDGLDVLKTVKAFCQKNNSKLLILHVAASRVGAMELKFVADTNFKDLVSSADVIYNLGMDEVDLPKNSFIIYQGSHGDRGAHSADIILPGAAYTEESGIFLNTEGRPQMANKANFPPGQAKENWAIIRAISDYLKVTLPYNNLFELRKNMFNEFPTLSRLDSIEEHELLDCVETRLNSTKAFENIYSNFFKTNPIARASLVMNELDKLSKEDAEEVAAE